MTRTERVLLAIAAVLGVLLAGQIIDAAPTGEFVQLRYWLFT